MQTNNRKWIVEHFWLPLVAGILSAIISGVLVFFITSAIDERKFSPSNLPLGDYLDDVTDDMTLEEMLQNINEQIESLHKENNALNIENTKLEDENLALIDIEKSYYDLQELYHSLENQNAQLIDEYSELQKSIKTYYTRQGKQTHQHLPQVPQLQNCGLTNLMYFIMRGVTKVAQTQMAGMKFGTQVSKKIL